MIVVRRLNKTYGDDVQALVDVNLAIPSGEFVFLVGPNGAGKSTLLKVLTREEESTSGSVLVFGRSLHDLTPGELAEHRRRLGTVFQDARLVATKTVFENVLLPLDIDGLEEEPAAERAREALETANLQDLSERFPEELSGGQQQRVAIARALVSRPHAIIADEPTGNLSPQATQEIMALLASINQTGITVIMATHNLETVDEMGRRVVALDSGHVVADVATSGYPDFLRKMAA